MSQLTPTQRLQFLKSEEKFNSAHSAVDELLRQYEKFLASTRSGDDALFELFSEKEQGNRLMEESYQFGDLMYAVLKTLEESTTSEFERRYIRLMFV